MTTSTTFLCVMLVLNKLGGKTIRQQEATNKTSALLTFCQILDLVTRFEILSYL